MASKLTATTDPSFLRAHALSARYELGVGVPTARCRWLDLTNVHENIVSIPPSFDRMVTLL